MSLDPDALAVMSLVGMTTLEERLYLRQLAEIWFTGRGAVVDLGSWLGSTVAALAQGLELNRRSEAQTACVHAYDLFRWASYMDGHVAESELAGRYLPGDSFVDEFQRRVKPWQGRVQVHAGDLATAVWQQGPIELLIVDAMKSWELAEAIAREFYPALTPGASRLLHQDFAHYATPWIPLAMYRLQHCFQPVAHVPNSGTVDFLCVATPTPEDLAQAGERCQNGQEIEAAFAYARKITDATVWPQLDAAWVLALAHAGHDDWPVALQAARKKYPHRRSLFDEVARQLSEEPLASAALSPGVNDAWRVALEQSLPALMAGVNYQLAWRMRAEAPRSVHVTITAGHEPWTQAGPYLPYRVGRHWQQMRVKFTPSVDELDAVLQFRLGESNETFEAADVVLTPLGRPKQPEFPLDPAGWRMSLADDAVAAVAVPQPDDRLVRVEFRPPTEEEAQRRQSDSIRLEHDLEPLSADCDYELRFDARADRGRDVEIAVAMAHEPWTELGLFQRLRLWSEWQSFCIPLRPVMTEFDPRIVVKAGGSRVPFEIGNVVVVGDGKNQSPDLRGWELHWSEESPAALFFRVGPPRSVRVAYPDEVMRDEPDDIAWKIQVQQCTPAVSAGTHCRLTLRAKADRSRDVSLALMQGSPPFEPLSSVEWVRLWPDWRELALDFTVEQDDDEPRFAISLGQSLTPIDVADVRLETRLPSGERKSMSLMDPEMRQLWRVSSTPTRLVSRDNGWRLEFPAE